MIYFVHGPDRLLAQQAVASIALNLDPDGANTSHFDGRDASVERIASAVGSASFFGSPRVVIVSGMFGKGTADPASESDDGPDGAAPSKTGALLSVLLGAVPEENCLIIHEPAMAAAPAALKSAAARVTVIAGEPPRGNALIAWIVQTAERVGAAIDRRTAQLLAETLFPQTWDRKPSNPRYDRPPDLAHLQTEIDKLALAAYPGSIQTEHIQTLVSGGPDQRLFRFVDAALNGDLRQALTEAERLAAAGEEPAMLLAQVLNQAELAAPAAAAGSRDAAAVARDLGTVAPGRMSAVMSSLRGRNAPLIAAAVERGTLADRKLKTGRTRKPETALHDLLVDLSLPTRR